VTPADCDLVTGAGGFIGGHLCRALAQAGRTVQAWVRPGTAGRSALPCSGPGIHRREVDVRDAAAVAAALAAWPPARVFHLAGIRLFGNHAANLAQMFDTQVQGTLNLLQGLPAATRVVVAGSCEEYGRAPVPFDEARPAQAQTAYAVSRLATTLACLSLAEPAISVARLSVVYGPGQVGEMFIPSLMQACARGQPFAMSSGEQTRDFLYVDDAVRGLIALADSDAAIRQVVNVGSAREITVRQVAEQVAQLAGNSARLQIGAIASRPGEASRYGCAIDKMQALTGWQPQVDLPEGLARTLAWWRVQPDGH
jgi:nucleoside-diphosphate-sugar epimerase